MANISNHYDTYNYYKVADGVTFLDLTGVGKINLHGSFDGNGVQITNLTTALFERVGYQNSVETIKISNLTATMNVMDGRAFVRNIFNAGNTFFENVTLQVNQYDADGDLLATGSLTVHTFAEPSAE